MAITSKVSRRGKVKSTHVRLESRCHLPAAALFTQRARTAIAIAPMAITTAKVVANKTQIIPILPTNAIIAMKRKNPAP